MKYLNIVSILVIILLFSSGCLVKKVDYNYDPPEIKVKPIKIKSSNGILHYKVGIPVRNYDYSDCANDYKITFKSGLPTSLNRESVSIVKKSPHYKITTPPTLPVSKQKTIKCAVLPEIKTNPPKLYSSIGKDIVEYSKKFVGIPYLYGGEDPQTGFDCSGFVQYVYSKFGVNLPRTADKQFCVGTSVPREELQPGDLVFFSSGRWAIGHVGIYVGNDKFIHAPNKGRVVSFDSLKTKNYENRFRGAKRVTG